MSVFKRFGLPQGVTPMFSGRGIAKLILPLIIQNVLSVAVGAVDTVMVSYAGEAAVSGVSLVNSLDTLLVLFFSSLVTGGAVIVAQAIGKKKKDEAQETSKQLLYASTAMALLLSVAVIIFRKPLLNLLFGEAEEAVMVSAERYFFYIAMSFPMLAISSSITAIFRVAGNSFAAMIVSVATNLINIGGNALLIMGFEMGSAGAAISTLVARFVGAAVMLILLNRKNGIFYIERLLHYKPNLGVIKEILRIGVPNGVEDAMFQFGRLLTQTLISSMGTATIAANAVALTVSNFQYTAGSAYSGAMITVVGRCVGAEDEKQAKYYSRLIAALNYMTLWLIVAVTVGLITPIVSLYDLSPASADIAKQLIIYHSVCAAVLWPIAFMMPSAFRAAKDVRFPLIVSLVSMWVFRVAGSYVLALETVSVFGLFSFSGAGMGIMGVWVAMTVDWAFRFALFLARYLSGRWLKQNKPKVSKRSLLLSKR
ncbi:MAG: MATE family efflux transporter [Clostridia bacterium]|nr:MATE family efflux transporter [Clostridia bacterium]MBQ8850749.1 MATE family efflux transporter [Clostridia bacterium]